MFLPFAYHNDKGGNEKECTSKTYFDVAMMESPRLNNICVPSYAMAADFRLQSLILRIGEEGS